MKEREEEKKNRIEDKILIKEASVKEIKEHKKIIIEEKKVMDHQKRFEKKLAIIETVEQVKRVQKLSLERIDEENDKFQK